ncbi:hypothetical protein ACQP2X_12615 [Actinoplanes sp. CA-131856]
MAARRRARTSARYALSAYDRNGRIADRSIVEAMGWKAHQRITVSVIDDKVVIRADPNSPYALTGDAFLRLAAETRHSFGVQVGDRLLLAAYPNRNLVLICPIAVLDDLTAIHVDGL